MSEQKDGCVKPARGPILAASDTAVPVQENSQYMEVKKMLATVGKEAIDFEANAFIANVGFKPVKLSEYKGKWIVLCFYPGDFTFV